MVVRVHDQKNHWMLGRVVQCKEFVHEHGVAMWMLVEAIEEPDPSPLEWDCVADACLRPIRDPGDDASDETLEWLPVPSRDEVTA
jgi:hypothetical protein